MAQQDTKTKGQPYQVEMTEFTIIVALAKDSAAQKQLDTLLAGKEARKEPIVLTGTGAVAFVGALASLEQHAAEEGERQGRNGS